MTPDPLMASVANVAAAGERLRRELGNIQRRHPGAEAVGVVTELMMFYGQAFANVQLALPDPFSSDALTTAVLHECVCGAAIHRLWLGTETALNSQTECARMAGHWQAVTDLLVTADP